MVCVKSWKSCFCFIALLRWHDAEALTVARIVVRALPDLGNSLGECSQTSSSSSGAIREIRAAGSQVRVILVGAVNDPHGVFPCGEIEVVCDAAALVTLLKSRKNRFAFYER